jgi:hypothetical protein
MNSISGGQYRPLLSTMAEGIAASQRNRDFSMKYRGKYKLERLRWSDYFMSTKYNRR